MNRAQEIQRELEDAITITDAESRDNGHDPHPWVRDTNYTAHTGCRACGVKACVRVYPDHVWRATMGKRCAAERRQVA